MMQKKITRLFLAAAVLGGLFSPAGLMFAAGKAAVVKTPVPPKPAVLNPKTSPQEELTHEAIRERVAVLRSQRIEKMPYLDKAFIRSAVGEKNVMERESFVSSGPKSLDDMIERAIQSYLPARVAHEKMELAHRRILVALRNLLPTAQVEVNGQRGSLSGSGYNRRNTILHFSQPIFHGGILWNTILKHKATLKQAARDSDKTVADLVRDVSQAYFEYQRALMAAAERKQMLEDTAKHVDISKKKWDAQLISEIESLNVESVRGQMESDYEAAQQDLALARLELQKFLDLDLSENLRIKMLYNIDDFLSASAQAEPESPKSDKTAKGTPAKGRKTAPAGKRADKIPAIAGVKLPAVEELVDIAYRERPELQSAAAGLRAAKLEEKIQWGSFMPEVDFIVDYGRNGEAFNDTTTHPSLNTQYKIGVEFKWNVAGNKTEYTFSNEKTPPSVSTFQSASGSQTTGNAAKFGLLDGLDVFVNIKDAEVQKLEQVVALDDAEKEVVKSVKEAFYEYQKAAIQLRSGIQRLNYRDRLLKLSLHRLGKNEVEISEYLQAQQDFITQKIELHKTIADYFTARAKLNRAVGRPDFLPVERIFAA